MGIKLFLILFLTINTVAYAQNNFIESCLSLLEHFSPPAIEINSLDGRILRLRIGSQIGHSSAKIFRSVDGNYTIKLMYLSDIPEFKIMSRQNLVYHEFYATEYLLELGLDVQRYMAVPVEMNIPGHGRVMISVKEYISGIDYNSMVEQLNMRVLIQSDVDFYRRRIQELRHLILPRYEQYFTYGQFMNWMRNRIDPNYFIDRWGMEGDVNLRDFIFSNGRWILLDP